MTLDAHPTDLGVGTTMDLKNRAAAASLNSYDEELSEHTSVRVAAKSPTPTPAVEDAEPIDFTADIVTDEPVEEVERDAPPRVATVEPTPQELRAIEEGGGD